MRIAAFLAIRKLANAADNAMLDLVMKVGISIPYMIPLLMTTPEHVPRVGALLEIYKPA